MTLLLRIVYLLSVSVCLYPLAHVRVDVDLVGKDGDVHLEARLHRGELIGVVLVGDEADGQALGAEAPGTPHAMEVLVTCLARGGHRLAWLAGADAWEVVVDDDVHALDVNAAAEQVRGHQDALLEVFELSVLGNAVWLRHLSVNAHGGEVALLEEAVELDGALVLGHEDHHLVELEAVQQVRELAVLLLLLQLHVVLDQPVQGELGVAVDVHLEGVLGELLAHGPHGVRESGGEHHHLLLVRRGLEDLLQVAAHVELLQQPVALVQHEVLELVELRLAFGDQAFDAPRGRHHDVRAVRGKEGHVFGDGHAPEDDLRLDTGEVLGKAVVLALDLVRKFARVAHDQHRHLAIHRLKLVQRSENKHSGLPHSRFCLANDIHTQNRLRDALLLDL
mmetsp:Transcript_9195/g.16849  ORF Transcript_9195/g.16849 Transcript_9195/m.16849 type:complete len:392 (+) Transcript_9195:196-1371(+)